MPFGSPVQICFYLAELGGFKRTDLHTHQFLINEKKSALFINLLMQFQAVIAQHQCWDTPGKSGREGFGRKPPASGWAPGALQATSSLGLATRSPGLNV